MKEKDMKIKNLKIKEKKDGLKVLDRNSRTPRQRDSRINTGMKAAFIRSAAEHRERKPEDGMSIAANEAAETYETAAIGIGGYGAARLKKAFRQEKSGARLEHSRQREKTDRYDDAASRLEQEEMAAKDKGIHNENLQYRYEAAQEQTSPAGNKAVQRYQQNNISETQVKREPDQWGVLQVGTVHRQDTKSYPRTHATHLRHNAGLSQDNLLKRDFLEKHRRKQENRKTPQYGQYQPQENDIPSPARSHSAGYGADVGKAAGGRGIGKYKAEKRHRYAGNVGRNVGYRQGQNEAALAEKKKLTVAQKLKNRFLSEKPIHRTSGRKSSFRTRLRQSAERAAAALAKDMLAALGSLGGAVVLMVIIAVVVALLSTSFGIFFSSFDQSEGTKTVSEIVAEVNGEFYAEAAEIANNVKHDKVVYHNQPDGASSLFITNWPDVIAIFSAKVSGEPDHALDAVTMDSERETLLKKIFWDMNALSYDTEETGEGIVLHIRHTGKSYAEMMEVYHFTPYQKQAAAEMMKPEYAQMLSELIGTLGVSGGGSVALTPEQAREMLANLPENLSAERKAVMRAAYSLVGKVNYFWGGKSAAIGWDSRWGTPKKVTAAGSSMTGTTRPFGLDCSGFVTWAFINATGNPDYANVIGHGAANQYGRCKKISWSEAQAGDLVFYPDLGHVGIIAGTDADGNLLVVHCASSQNNVVVTGLQGFTRIGRPVLFG